MRRFALAALLIGCPRAPAPPPPHHAAAVTEGGPRRVHARAKKDYGDWCVAGHDRILANDVEGIVEVRANGDVLRHPDVPMVQVVGPTEAFWFDRVADEDQRPDGPGAFAHRMGLPTGRHLPDIRMPLAPVAGFADSERLYLGFAWTCAKGGIDMCGALTATELKTGKSVDIIPNGPSFSLHIAAGGDELFWVGRRDKDTALWATRAGTTRRVADSPLDASYDCCKLQVTTDAVYLAAQDRLVRAPRAGGPLVDVWRAPTSLGPNRRIRHFRVEGDRAYASAAKAIYAINLADATTTTIVVAEADIAQFVAREGLLWCTADGVYTQAMTSKN